MRAEDLESRLIRFRALPGSEEPRGLAEELLRANRPADAIEVAGLALLDSPDDAALLIVEGRAYLAAGDLLRAQAALLRAARSAPNAKSAYRWLGEVLLKRGDPQRAVKVLERARALDASDPDVEKLLSRATRLSSIDSAPVEDVSDVGAAPAPPPRPAPPSPAARPAPAPPSAPEPTSTGARPASGTRSGGRPRGPESDTLVSPPSAPIAIAERKKSSRPPAVADSMSVTIVRDDPKHKETDEGPTEVYSAEVLRKHLTDSAEDHRAVPRSSEDAWPAPDRSPNERFPSDEDSDLVPTRARAQPLGAQLDEEDADETTNTAARAEPAPRFPPAASPDRLFTEASDENLFERNRAAPLAPDSLPEPVPDERVGRDYGEAEDVDGILQMLASEGIFEQPGETQGAWATRKELPKNEMRLWRLVLVAWVVAAITAGSGYYGWTLWVEKKHSDAVVLRDEAGALLLSGDHADLVDAERKLRLARDRNPHDVDIARILLLVHAQRALEDGAFDAAFMTPSLDRAARMHVAPEYVKAATAVLAAASSDLDRARSSLDEALAAAPDDPNVLYLVGRLRQRLGGEDALEQLEQAIQREPNLAAATIALAEARADEGQRDEAIRLLDGLLARKPDHLRATLFRGFIGADDAEPDPALAALDGLSARLHDHGAPTDRVVAALTKARLLRRKGAQERAQEAVDQAASAGGSDPRLLALVAAEAQAVGRLTRAQEAAMGAVASAPTNPDFRKLLAEILLERRNGVRVLATLQALSMNDPDVLRLSARAALLVGTDEALSAAASALDAYVTSHEDASVEMKSLRLRAQVRLGPMRPELLTEASALSASAPGDPDAAQGLGEAALAARNAPLAQDALQGLVGAMPEDAEAHYLLGRAQRLAGNADAAEASFRRALALASEYGEAQVALGRLLLDAGKFEEADAVYQELGRYTGFAAGIATPLVGRVGRVEALIGLGRLDDAEVQLSGVRPQDRESSAARIAAGQLAMARRRPGDAVSQLRPVAEAETASEGTIALYADALALAGEEEAALVQYDRALALDAGLPEALLGKAAISITNEDDRGAAPLLEAASAALRTRVRPPAFRARELLLEGRLLLLGGRRTQEDALAKLTEAIAEPGAPAEAFFFLGEARSANGNSEARAAYQRYLELAPEGQYATTARRRLR